MPAYIPVVVKKTKFSRSVPQCATKEQWRTWKEQAIRPGAMPDPKVGFCTDCTPEFQKEMREQGRCENPEIKFYREKPRMKVKEGRVTTIHGGELYGALEPGRHMDDVVGVYVTDEEVTSSRLEAPPHTP